MGITQTAHKTLTYSCLLSRKSCREKRAEYMYMMYSIRKSLKLPEIPKSFLYLGIFILFASSFPFLISQGQVCCDAITYLAAAKLINTEGLLAFKDPIRTFGYPWILSIVTSASRFFNMPDLIFIFLFQVLFYYFSIVYITNILIRRSKVIAITVYIALCSNIFVHPYLSVTLTDSLYTSLCLFLFGWLLKNESPSMTKESTNLFTIFFGVFLLCTAIIVRPAATWLTIPVFLYLAKLLWAERYAFSNILFGIFLGGIPLYIQIFINKLNHNELSFLPAAKLGTKQISWGIENIKYSTYLNSSNRYSSRELIGIPHEKLNLLWYFEHPISAVKLITFKLIGAFDFDFLIPYPSSQPGYSWALSFISFTILWMGVFAVILHLFYKKLPILGSRFTPFVIFASWGSVSLLTALELRFTFPLLSYFIILGSVLVNSFFTEQSKKIPILFITGWVVFLPAFFWAAYFIRAQSRIFG